MAVGAVFLGDPVMDLLVHVDERFLDGNRLQAGGCLALGNEQLRHLLTAAERVGLPARCAQVRLLD